MLTAFFNIFKIPELRNKLLFTIGMLVIYRIGFWIPLPGVNQRALAEFMKQQQEQGNALGDLAGFISMFTGGALGQSTLFGLGILPYISAAIIIQLMATVVESLKQLQKEPAGQQKIQEYTRYLTFGLCVVQSIFYLKFFSSMNADGVPLVYDHLRGGLTYWTCGVLGMTTGTMFLMWLGEQIDKYGIGNGASLIITAGIIAQMPNAILEIVTRFDFDAVGDADKLGPMKVAMLVLAFLVVTAGTVLITQGQRRIPVQQAKHTRGRRVYGGQRSYLPLRVNHGGVMPIIFASSLMMFPTMIFPWLSELGKKAEWPWMISTFEWLGRELSMSGYQYLHVLLYVAMIYFFAYFWTSVQFQPKEMAERLRDNGSFIPGLRPGPRTADYLETVMERITYVGAGFLSVIAVVPTIISRAFGVSFMVASFLGGTGLLISVSVALDFVQRIEANLLMRNYQGFLSGGEGPGGGRGPKIRSSRGA
ncbi:MAG: preprotein translocase subunit SecY [Phycisphaeraceae bacterium]|nr:preprotein translocase subunit SecY [Phycisphaeraceae bacterium]